jgi:hypothetical protein
VHGISNGKKSDLNDSKEVVSVISVVSRLVALIVLVICTEGLSSLLLWQDVPTIKHINKNLFIILISLWTNGLKKVEVLGCLKHAATIFYLFLNSALFLKIQHIPQVIR